jgi:hypothetical protein
MSKEASWGYQSIKTSDAYRDGWDRIWGEKEDEEESYKTPGESAFEALLSAVMPGVKFVQAEPDE